MAPEPARGSRAGQSPAERTRWSAHGGPGQPDQPETQPQPLPELGRAAQGAARRAGRAGRGRPPGTHPRRGCASRGRGPQSRGLMAGGGPGRRPHIPPVAGGCRATVRRREEGRGPGGGGPWQPGRPGRMTMEGNALSESESGPRGRGGRGPALAALGHTTPAGFAQRHTGWLQTPIAAGRGTPPREAAPNPERGTLPDPRAAAEPQPPRGAAPSAQFPETQIPECTHPCIHSVHERASMFTQARVIYTSGKDSRAHIYTIRSPREESYTWKNRTRLESQSRNPRRHPPPPTRAPPHSTPHTHKQDSPQESFRI